MTIHEQVARIADAFREGLHGILRNKLYGAYVYGAAAFPDAVPTGDIDFHVILKGPLTASERAALEALHEDLGRRFPPLGVDMDGYYLLLEDARRTTPPRSQMWARAVDTSWALHREHIRAGRCIVLHGPDPSEIYLPATWPELEAALFSELDYVERHLQDYPDYCILNLCRLIYSFETRAVVVSKAAAAAWATDALPAWKRAIDLACTSYPGQATPEERQFLRAQAGGLLAVAQARIEACR
jgi:hypothetical protein